MSRVAILQIRAVYRSDILWGIEKKKKKLEYLSKYRTVRNVRTRFENSREKFEFAFMQQKERSTRLF